MKYLLALFLLSYAASAQVFVCTDRVDGCTGFTDNEWPATPVHFNPGDIIDEDYDDVLADDPFDDDDEPSDWGWKELDGPWQPSPAPQPPFIPWFCFGCFGLGSLPAPGSPYPPNPAWIGVR